MQHNYFIYILSSKSNTVLYIGVTSKLAQRVSQHRLGIFEGFSKKCKTRRLVYYEVFDDIENAIAREKQLKNWHRDWKINLIAEQNPDWDDLFLEITR